MLHETLQPLLAPVVLISACGLLTMSLNNRATACTTSIRRLHHERLEISERAAAAGGSTPTERLRYEGVGTQSEQLLRRLRLVRRALVCVVGCVVLMLVSSLSIGLAELTEDSPFESVAVLAFVAGLVSLLVGALTFLVELRISLNEIAYEHDRMLGLSLLGGADRGSRRPSDRQQLTPNASSPRRRAGSVP